MTSVPLSTGDGSWWRDESGRRTGLSARFLMAAGREVDQTALTPAVLARAITEVLPVDGASLSSMVQVLRLPLGASGDAAARAEELQTSLGEGPCLEAAEARAAVVADHDDLMTSWPHYAEELTARTPFRAVAAIPLMAPGRGVFAALDLYSTDPRLSDQLDLAQLDQHLAAPVAALLHVFVEQVGDVDNPDVLPDWYQTATRRRLYVWIAIGMVMAKRPGPVAEALSLLRAHAYTLDRTIDDLAEDLVNRRLPVIDLVD